jgi:hypothetical protein
MIGEHPPGRIQGGPCDPAGLSSPEGVVLQSQFTPKSIRATVTADGTAVSK